MERLMDLEGKGKIKVTNGGVTGSPFFIEEDCNGMEICYGCGDQVFGTINQAVCMLEYGDEVEFRDIEGVRLCDGCFDKVKDNF